jgi:hypothetical protein
VATALKAVYTAVDAGAAEAALTAFEEGDLARCFSRQVLFRKRGSSPALDLVSAKSNLMI